MLRAAHTHTTSPAETATKPELWGSDEEEGEGSQDGGSQDEGSQDELEEGSEEDGMEELGSSGEELQDEFDAMEEEEEEEPKPKGKKGEKPRYVVRWTQHLPQPHPASLSSPTPASPQRGQEPEEGEAEHPGGHRGRGA